MVRKYSVCSKKHFLLRLIFGSYKKDFNLWEFSVDIFVLTRHIAGKG
jgi:hypothetical protein